jgi:hypothetical protein
VSTNEKESITNGAIEATFLPEPEVAEPEDEWPEPDDLGGNGDKAPPFPTDLLPGALRPFVRQAAELMDSPPEMIAIPALVAAGAMLGLKPKIQMKQIDTKWKERAALWGAVIAPPSAAKTPCASQALRPIERLQDTLTHQYREAVKEAKALGKQDDELPIRETIYFNECTGEKVAQIMSPDFNSAHGSLLYRDELAGWFEGMNKYRAGDDLELYLQAFSGSPYTRQLVKGDVYVPESFLCIFGTIQPEKAKAIFGNRAEDGLTARFGLVAVVSSPGGMLVDRERDSRIDAAYEQALTQLREVRERTVKFSPEAWKLFFDWHNHLKKRPEAKREDGFSSHINKYPSLFGRLCLVFHFLKHGAKAPDLVSLETAKAVRRLINEFLEPHARRLYGIVHANALDPGARRIASWIREEGRETFSPRDIHRKCWKEFDATDVMSLISKTL